MSGLHDFSLTSQATRAWSVRLTHLATGTDIYIDWAQFYRPDCRLWDLLLWSCTA